MAAQFKTSFIPKSVPTTNGGGTVVQPTVKQRGMPVDLFLLIGTILFVVAIVGAFGLFLYKFMINRDITQASTQLEAVRKDIDPNLITKLQGIDTRMDEAKNVLANHQALTPLFLLLEQNTVRTVRFTSFEFSQSDGVFQINLRGEAKNYQSLALEADVLAQAGVIHNAVFSGLNINTTDGNVSFQMIANVAPSVFAYVPAVPANEAP